MRTSRSMRPPPSPETALAELERQQLLRVRHTVADYAEPHSTTHAIVAGRRLLNFCGNDYLGLARHPEVTGALREAASRYGVGSGASHLITGHGREHARLEEELAAFVGSERALLFSTGYMANLAALTTFAGRADRVLLDRLSHASLIDAALLSGARLRRFAHADAAAAERMLAEPSGSMRPQRSTIIATDGLFSMDGDLAPLARLALAARAHAAWLIVDDAHGLGVLGKRGRGTLEHCGVDVREVPILIGTLGKAFGTFGAFIAGPAAVIELLIQRARSYIYTTALPQAVAAATRAALALAQRESWRRERVLALTAQFRAAAVTAGIPLAASFTPIQPLILGGAREVLAVSRRLFDAGFWVAAIRPPTVPRNAARLRLTFSAAHTEEQVGALVHALSGALHGMAQAS